MTTKVKHDTFEELLPPEIILLILEALDDFVGLQSLLRTSAYVNSVFQSRSCVALNGVLTSHPITAEPEIRKLFRCIVLLNSPSAVKSVNSYASSIKNANSFNFSEVGLASYMVDVGAQVQRLACACLNTLREDLICALESSILTPSRINWRRRVATPFSWIEEYRAYRALWYLRYFSELEKVLYQWGWPLQDLNEDNCSTAFASLHDIEDFLHEEIWQVGRVLEKLELDCSPVPPGYFPLQDISLPHFRKFSLSSDTINHTWSCPPVPTTADDDFWARTRPFTADCSPACMEMVTACPLPLDMESLYMINSASLRRLGIAIWDNWRMQRAGLFPDSPLDDISIRDKLVRPATIRALDMRMWSRILKLAV